MIGEDIKVLAKAVEKTSRVIADMSKILRQQADVSKLLSDKILTLENRQDTLWKALQGVTQAISGMDKGEKDERA